jgi:hypothetical protein
MIGGLLGATWYLLSNTSKSNAPKSANVIVSLTPATPNSRTGSSAPGQSPADESDKAKVQLQPSVPPAPTNVSPPTAAPVVTPSATAQPGYMRGTLKIDSTPQGLTYEITDGVDRHRGTTPASVELPTGYAWLIYRSGNTDHREIVWIEGGRMSSRTWNANNDEGAKSDVQTTLWPTPATSPSQTLTAPSAWGNPAQIAADAKPSTTTAPEQVLTLKI